MTAHEDEVQQAPQIELFPQTDRCPTCGGRVTSRTDGFGRSFQVCRMCHKTSYLSAERRQQ